MPDSNIKNVQKLYNESDEVRAVLGQYEEINKFYTASLRAMGLLQTVKLGIGNTAQNVEVSGSVSTTDK